MRRTIACLLILRGIAAAEEPTLRAEASASEIGIDETLQVTVTLARESADPLRSYVRPDFPDFELLHQGQSTSSQWLSANGQQVVRLLEKHVYVLRPRKRGKCIIQPATAQVGAKEIRTTPITVLVLAPQRKLDPGAPPLPASLPSLLPPPEAMRGDEDMFVEARADRSSVFLGEPVVVSWYLLSQADILRYRTTVEPKHDEFWSEDIFVPGGPLSWDRVDVKGRAYQGALLLKRALFPLKAGRLTVSPMQVEATTMQTAFYPTGSAVKSSRALSVDVQPLPAAGRPEGFEPTNVGRYTLQTAIDRTSGKAGEAFTVRITVRGEGNLHNLKLPRLDKLDGLRAYEPQVGERIERGDTIHGERTITYLLVPERGGKLSIPSLRLAFFDPREKRYQVVASAPIALEVEGSAPADGKPAAPPPGENLLGPKLLPLRDVHVVSTRLGVRLLRGPWIIVGLAVPPGLLALTLLVTALRRRLGRETPGSKRRRARAAARSRLREAEAHLRTQDAPAFFAACARALHDHLEFRLRENCAAMTMSELQEHLTRRGFDDEVVARTIAELESADYARFAPAASSPTEMRAALKRVGALVEAIDRARVKEAS